MTAGVERSSRETGCEIFAALMKADRTQRDLERVCGLSRRAIEHWLAEMRRSGLIYRQKGSQPPGQRGRSPTVYCLQPKPFERKDWS